MHTNLATIEIILIIAHCPNGKTGCLIIQITQKNGRHVLVDIIISHILPWWDMLGSQQLILYHYSHSPMVIKQWKEIVNFDLIFIIPYI